ncbi:MAG: hypothetical protein QNJ53_27320 [Pleurocapsa sp. MO_192.B19]|nr:hypothetical protein [Pleurocapsa sp. MO_192.B19]
MWSSDIVLGLAIIVAFCFCWAVLMFTISKQESVIENFFLKGIVLRLLSVIFITVISGYLVTIDRLPTELLASLYSGIAGYVLGGIEKTTTNKEKIKAKEERSLPSSSENHPS